MKAGFWRNALKLILSVSISGGLLYIAFIGVPFSEVIEPFQKANYFWLFISALLAILSHLSRAYRWRQLLAPMGYRPSIFHAFLSVMVGYFVNFAIPRGGEVSRCGMIQKLSKVPASTAFGTVVLERLVDLLMLLLLIIALFIIEFTRLSDLLGEHFTFPELPFWLFFALTFGGLTALFIFWQLWKHYQTSLAQNALFLRLKQILDNVLKGIISIRNVRNKPLFWAHTIFIWLMYYNMAYVLFFCFPETSHLTPWFGYIVLITGGIGMSAPVQGGIGTYHLLVGTVFMWQGFTMQAGTIMATFMHTAQTLVVLVFGGISFMIALWLIARKSSHK